MALSFLAVPDSEIYLGVGNRQKMFLALPGTNDYPNPGGWAVTAAALGFQRISQFDVQSSNSTFAGYVFTVAMAWPTSNPPPGLTSLNVQLYWTGAALSGVLAQPANNANFSGGVFACVVQGY